MLEQLKENLFISVAGSSPPPPLSFPLISIMIKWSRPGVIPAADMTVVSVGYYTLPQSWLSWEQTVTVQ